MAGSITQGDLLDRLEGHVRGSDDGRPALTLVIGSGFSHGIIPTTAEIVARELPLWLYCRKEKRLADFVKHDRDAALVNEAQAYATGLWSKIKKVADQRPALGEGGHGFELADDSGLPSREGQSKAYTAAFSPWCPHGLSTPDLGRRFLRDLIRRAGNRLNPAHLYLGALLAERPGCCGTVFTTNFDPLLQRALQLVNLPYFVSDRPDTMQTPDDDGAADALHIVHAHGSIYRYLLLNSPEQIDQYARQNHSLLVDYFRKHAVLIIGYGGWDDAITRALCEVEQFHHALYWCDRSADVKTSGLSADAQKILSKHSNAFYVPIKGADDLAAALYERLAGHALPRLFRQPIDVVLDQLQQCSLAGVVLPRSSGSGDKETPKADEPLGTPGLVSGTAAAPILEDLDLGREAESVRERLKRAKDVFEGKTLSTGEQAKAAAVQAMAEASDLYFRSEWPKVVTLLTKAIDSQQLDLHDLALAHFRRGYAHGKSGDTARAIADYTVAVGMAEAPAEQRANALYNRGIAYGLSGDTAREIADYTVVVGMAEAPAEQRASALYNRGVVYGLSGDMARAIADFTSVIDMAETPAEQRATALYNRGVAYGKSGDPVREIADYTSVIEMVEAPAEQRANALTNRGVAYGRAGDTARAIADSTLVIEMMEAPAAQRTVALINRGVAHGRAGDVAQEIVDYTSVIDMVEAPAEQRAKALTNRGVAYGRAGDMVRAIVDYTSVIGMVEASAEQRAVALTNRGVTYGKSGDPARAIADYTSVIEMAEAPAEQRAKALTNRGIVYGVSRDTARAIADYASVIGMVEASVEQRAEALINRGITYGQSGDMVRAIADFTSAIGMAEASTEQRAKALTNRGVAYGRAGDTAREIADYTAVTGIFEASEEIRERARIALDQLRIYDEPPDSGSPKSS